MKESYISNLLKLFVHISKLEESLSYEYTKNFIIILLRKELHIKDYEEYIQLFDKYYKIEEDVEKPNVSFAKLNQLCKKLAEDLPLKQRIITIIYLLKFNGLFNDNVLHVSKEETNLEKAIRLISVHFKLKGDEVDNLNAFINNDVQDIYRKDNLVIAGQKNYLYGNKIIERNYLSGIIKFYYIESLKVFIFYLEGSDNIKLDNLEIIPYSMYFFTKGSLITGNSIETISFNDLLQMVFFNRKNYKITLTATDISFRYKHSTNGLKKFDFYAESGQFIGILGKSGAGKSTLMRLLTGNLIPLTGELKINDILIYKNQDRFNDLISYVPQYDTLISELTAYQNLYYYTKLWNNSLHRQVIDSKINTLLSALELVSIKDRIVGTEFERSISGGERKRLNLALELIRDPKVLFVDEPTSGLSSSDSETIIKLLQGQAFNGMLVVINIHQPSSLIFKSFDKVIILDTGGYPVYFGNPLLAYETLARSINLDERISDTIEDSLTTNAENIFQILEQKEVDRYGVYTHERKILPKEWHNFFIKRNAGIKSDTIKQDELPEVIKIEQNYFVQWLIYFKRNLLIKKVDVQYLVVSLFTAPVLATILALLCRSSSNDTNEYLFYYNRNIPAFLLMSVIVALFTGLMSSAEEIHRDKLVNAREQLLKVSNHSYLLSKVSFVFIVSAIQMLLYVVISNYILEIEGMNIQYWLMLWALSCTANLLGLMLSTIFKSVVSIYIFIPFLLIPQILLNGTVIKFKDINPKITSVKYVPLIGDVMPSRWAFEALAVNQFKNKNTELMLFNKNLIISTNSYLTYYLIPELIQQITDAQSTYQTDNLFSRTDSLYIFNGMKVINEWCTVKKEPLLEKREIIPRNFKEIKGQLEKKRQLFLNEIKRVQAQKEEFLQSLNSSGTNINKENTTKEKNNASLSAIMLNMDEVHPYVKVDGEYIRLFEPIYHIPANRFGRAQLFAPFKRIGGLLIDTYRFNIIVLGVINIFLYFILFWIYNYKIKHNNILAISK